MTTYAHPALVTDTGLIRMFPNSNNLGNPLRSAANVAGHFSLLVLAVVGVAYVTLKSILSSESLLASGPAIYAAWALMVFVGAGIFMTSYRYFLYGILYAVGTLLAMGMAEYFFGTAVPIGWTYHGLGLVALGAVVVKEVAPPSGRQSA